MLSRTAIIPFLAKNSNNFSKIIAPDASLNKVDIFWHKMNKGPL